MEANSVVELGKSQYQTTANNRCQRLEATFYFTQFADDQFLLHAMNCGTVLAEMRHNCGRSSYEWSAGTISHVHFLCGSAFL
jgi:hypothetical protein